MSCLRRQIDHQSSVTPRLARDTLTPTQRLGKKPHKVRRRKDSPVGGTADSCRGSGGDYTSNNSWWIEPCIPVWTRTQRSPSLSWRLLRIRFSREIQFLAGNRYATTGHRKDSPRKDKVESIQSLCKPASIKGCLLSKGSKDLKSGSTQEPPYCLRRKIV